VEVHQIGGIQAIAVNGYKLKPLTATTPNRKESRNTWKHETKTDSKACISTSLHFSA
jgi:hypothetical protein